MDTPEKRTVEEVIVKSLKERDNEKERHNRRRNLIVFELPESKKSEPEVRKEEDIKKFVGFCKGIIKIIFDHSMIELMIRLGKATDDRHWPLLISLKEEGKQDIFQNLNKIRESEVPFNKINLAHDLTKKQKEELQEKIKEAQEMHENDKSEEWIYRVRGPPWNLFIKRIPKRAFLKKPRRQGKKYQEFTPKEYEQKYNFLKITAALLVTK